MLVVKDCPKTFVLTKGVNSYIFRPNGDEVRVRFIDRTYHSVHTWTLSVPEARQLWEFAQSKGYERW